MTFSIVAHDTETGDLGIAVASKFLAVGAVCTYARAGVGAVVTQALANVAYGPSGLALMAQDNSASDALDRLTSADEGRSHRQAGIVDASGGAATYTGSECISWAGGRTADGVAAQGNLLVGPSVVDVLFDAYTGSTLPFPERLLHALKAADDQGGDRRGRQSAAIVVVREGGGYGGGNDRWIDLRVDDHSTPVAELMRLLDLNHLYMDRPAVEDLVAIDERLAIELRRMLEGAGYTPESISRRDSLAEVAEQTGMTRTGEPRPLPDNWDAAWESSLIEWMSIENLEERAAASGWIDPRVLDFLRSRAG